MMVDGNAFGPSNGVGEKRMGKLTLNSTSTSSLASCSCSNLWTIVSI